MSEFVLAAAPAKLNLFLHVTGRRADGMHELQTLFQLLDYGDSLRLRVRRSAGIRLRCYGLHLAHKDNLVVRAAELLAETCRVRSGADIELYKRVPAASGLGGGSSDAASALHALNHLWRCGLSIPQLARLGAALGADVPVFVHGRSAWGEGVGDIVRPLSLPPSWYVVLTPSQPVSTAQLYAELRLTNYQLPITIDDYWLGKTDNVFEPLLVKRCPEVRQLRDWLNKHAPARLSGSGGSVFAAFSDRKAARRVFSEKPKSVEGFLCQGIASSPLLREFAAC